jgi:hypothetical protein
MNRICYFEVMAFKKRGPKRRIDWDNQVYSVKSDKIEVPNFKDMDRLSVLMWLNKNTYRKGYTTRKVNPLAGLGGAITLKIRS